MSRRSLPRSHRLERQLILRRPQVQVRLRPHPVQPTLTTDIPQDGDSSGQASAEGDDEFELRSDEESEVSSDSFDPDDYRDAPG